jgi:hypothetical protein
MSIFPLCFISHTGWFILFPGVFVPHLTRSLLSLAKQNMQMKEITYHRAHTQLRSHMTQVQSVLEGSTDDKLISIHQSVYSYCL